MVVLSGMTMQRPEGSPGHGGSGWVGNPNPAEIFCNREINFHNLEVGGVVEVRRSREAGEGNRAAYNGSVPICVAVAEEDLQPI